MKSMRHAVLSAIFLLACLDVHAAMPAFQLTDLQRIVSLSDPQISPDGKQIAMIVSTDRKSVV